MQVDAARGDIDLDLIAGLHQRQRPADKALRRHVQNASAVAGAAHARVGNAQLSRTPALRSFFGIGSWPHSGMPGPPFGPPFLSTKTWSGVASRSSRSTSRAIWS